MFYQSGQKIKINGQERIVCSDIGAGIFVMDPHAKLFSGISYFDKKENLIEVVDEHEGDKIEECDEKGNVNCMEITEQLKRCPFCGGEAVTVSMPTPDGKYWIVVCSFCEARTDSYHDAAEAEKAWNMRHRGGNGND